MPRRERRQAARAITAAGRGFTSSRAQAKKSESVRGGEMWQRSGWEFYNLVGEYRQAPTIQGALLSRAKLTVLERNAAGVWEPTKNAAALTALDMLYGGEEGQSEMFRLFGEHLTVAGEGFLVSPPADQWDDPQAWQVTAATQTVMRDGVWKVNGKELDGGPRKVIQIWRPHPENNKKPNSPTMAAIPILSILVQLMKRTAAQVDSRLTGNGLVLLPSETEFPSGPTRQLNQGEQAFIDSVDANDPQGLADLIMETARVAIQDPSSAEAMLPIFGMAPGEFLKDAKHLTFWSELDKAAPALREELITRLARTMDIPVDVLLGAAGSNHWNAWLSDENNVKVHAEPTLKIITTALTTEYLRVLLAGAEGVDDPRRFKFWADTSEMRLRANRSKEALELNDRMILSDAAAMRENGFTEEDLMDEEGLKRAIMRKMVAGTSTPELVAFAARFFGIDVPEITDERQPVEGRPTPTLNDHPVRALPKAAADVDGVVFAAEQIVDRALQRLGNRLKSKLALRDAPLPANRLYMGVAAQNPSDMDDLLQDAWESCAIGDYGIPAKDLARALDIYTRSIVLSQQAPSRAAISASLRLLLSRPAA